MKIEEKIDELLRNIKELRNLLLDEADSNICASLVISCEDMECLLEELKEVKTSDFPGKIAKKKAMLSHTIYSLMKNQVSLEMLTGEDSEEVLAIKKLLRTTDTQMLYLREFCKKRDKLMEKI